MIKIEMKGNKFLKLSNMQGQSVLVSGIDSTLPVLDTFDSLVRILRLSDKQYRFGLCEFTGISKFGLDIEETARKTVSIELDGDANLTLELKLLKGSISTMRVIFDLTL